MKKLAATLLLLVSSFLSADEELAQAYRTQESAPTEIYKPKDFSYLLPLPGISDKTLNTHFKLYQGYVKNTNLLLSLLDQFAREGKEKTPQYAEVKRRLGWEFDGMRLHEYYFGNLGKDKAKLATNDPLYQRISQDFGSFEKWKADFIATGAMRGIGWAVLYFDPVQKRLINTWIGEHDIGHLAGGTPILIMDVWEHAYMLDYGIERGDYIKAFFDNINWQIVSNRFAKQISGEQKLPEKEERRP